MLVFWYGCEYTMALDQSICINHVRVSKMRGEVCPTGHADMMPGKWPAETARPHISRDKFNFI